MHKSKFTKKCDSIDFTKDQFSYLLQTEDGRWYFSYKPLDSETRFVSEPKIFKKAVHDRRQAMTTMARFLLGRAKINIEGIVGGGTNWTTLV